jgi:hypothetical protein
VSSNNDDRALVATPKVTTLARPSSNVLIAARFEVQRNERLRNLFEGYKGFPEEESVATLARQAAQILAEKLQGSEAEIQEAARFLADEYMQMGDSLLVISTTTGLPVAKLTEKDIWQPPPTTREDGRLVPQRPRMRPELEGFLVRWHFERDREKALVEELSARLATTQALTENGDRRLAAITREGRATLADELRAQLPTLLPDAQSTLARQFMRSFSFEEGDAAGGYRGFTAVARTHTLIADHKARNLKFDTMNVMRAKIATDWAREIARTVSHIAHDHLNVDLVKFAEYRADGAMWIVGDPNEFQALLTTFGPQGKFLVEGALTTVLAASIGQMVLKNFDLKHRVLHDRWEFAATVEYDVWLNFNAIAALKFTGIPPRTHVAEIV